MKYESAAGHNIRDSLKWIVDETYSDTDVRGVVYDLAKDGAQEAGATDQESRQVARMISDEWS